MVTWSRAAAGKKWKMVGFVNLLKKEMAGPWPIGSKAGKREKVEAMSFVWMMMLFAETETLGGVCECLVLVPLRMPVRNSNEDMRHLLVLNTLWSSRENIGQRCIIMEGGGSYSPETGEGLLLIYCLSTQIPLILPALWLLGASQVAQWVNNLPAM